jgi:two-component system chemotaxis response regulator CheB
MSELAPITTDALAVSAAGYGCPSCGGSLFQIDERPVPRYRCRVGHAWSPESLLDEQAAALESSLWMALRTLEERASLSQYLADLGNDPMRTHSPRYLSMAGEAERAAKMIRKLIEEVGATADGDVVESG